MIISPRTELKYLRWKSGPEVLSFLGATTDGRPSTDSAIATEQALRGPPAQRTPSRPASRKPGGFAPWRRRRVAQYIGENLEAPLRACDVAVIAKLSPDYFSRAFKASFGIHYTSYLRARRLELGRHMMLSTDMPLCQIALACGLADQAHFTRLFRREVGEPPGKWRRRATSRQASTRQQASS